MVKNLLLMEENICVENSDSNKPKLHSLVSEIKDTVSSLLTKHDANWQKEDGTLVSNTDILIQAYLIELLTTTYPKDNLLFEEGDKRIIKGSSNYTWVIDPIDGTQNFIEGKKEYSVSIGLMHENTFIESFVYFPACSIDLYAINEGGVWINGEKKKTSSGMSKPNSVILCSKTFHTLGPKLQLLGYEVNFYRCATYSILQVIMQKALFYHTINTMLYDVGPMSHILSEFGMKNYNNLLCEIQYTPSLERIPFFISANSDYNFSQEVKKILKIQN